MFTAFSSLPTPSPAPAAAISPASAPLSRPSPAKLHEIGQISAYGRRAQTVGTAPAASTGTISQEQIATRPLLRPGEILETIPGLVISQHSGEGKANQYYLRGFQLDHGTDLEGTINGEPVNLPTHAHGQGYSDINWLIPELVDHVEYKKGPYYADQGDFSTAGAYNLAYRDTLKPFVEYGAGDYGYSRFLIAGSKPQNSGSLLYALEVYHDNNALDRPDEYQKFNGVLRWSKQTAKDRFNVTGTAYSGTFNSTDQIPQRLVDAGILNRFGYIDPTDGGDTHRVSLTSEFTHKDPNGRTTASAYAFDSTLDLFSDFTYSLEDATDYYNVTQNPLTCNAAYTTCTPQATGPASHITSYTSYCPANSPPTGNAPAGSITPAPFRFACGDQREQQDIRFVSGFDLSRSFVTPASETTVGFGLRNDNISTVGLFLTNARIRYAGGTLSDDHVVERSTGIWTQSQVHLNSKLRVIGGLRGDLYNFKVAAYDPADSGKAVAALLSPKLTAAYKLSPQQEVYADYGESFHSNDARGITQTLDPLTHAAYDATGTPVTRVSPLVRAGGEELGYRVSSAKYNGTLTLWKLNIASELVFNGDDGTTSPNGPTVRRGVEFTNYYTASPVFTLDGDFATSSAHFLTNAENLGTAVPESINAVVAMGATLDKPKYAASLRLRYFGPRVLSQDGSAYSTPSTIFNGEYTLKGRDGRKARIDILNLLNSGADDIEYNYASWVPHDAANPALAANPAINPALGGAGVTDNDFHPSERRTVRLTLSTPL